jgi:NAD(P)-dependent dehydrogenase (short-subunit alcohol dehydrogenase family)
MAVWFVTDAARGIGRQVAVEALRRGNRLVVTVRDRDELVRSYEGVPGEILPIAMDITFHPGARSRPRRGRDGCLPPSRRPQRHGAR